MTSNLIYIAAHSRRRCRILLSLFRKVDRVPPRIESGLHQKSDATGKSAAFAWQKILVSFRRLADGSSYFSSEDGARISSESMRAAFRYFLRAMKECYRYEYLNGMPTEEELIRIESEYARSNFPGCIGALDWMNLRWKTFPSHGSDSITTPNQAVLQLYTSNVYLIVLHIVSMFMRDVPGLTMT